MAILRSKQIKTMKSEEVVKKIGELRFELMKETKPGQGASIKTREIKRTIARLLTHARNSMKDNVYHKK